MTSKSSDKVSISVTADDFVVLRREGAERVKKSRHNKDGIAVLKEPSDPAKAQRRIEERFGFTPDQLIPAIAEEHGLLSNICKRFKVPPSSLQRYLKLNEACGQAMRDAREAMGDVAEKKLFDLIVEGDVRCILYYLSTVHRHRGYGLRSGDDPFNEQSRPVFVETVNVVAVPSGTFLPPLPDKSKVIDN
jgi:hypothetical protein